MGGGKAGIVVGKDYHSRMMVADHAVWTSSFDEREGKKWKRLYNRKLRDTVS